MSGGWRALDQVSAPAALASSPAGLVNAPENASAPHPCAAITFRCRICGTDRRQANHWAIVEGELVQDGSIEIHNWNEELAALIPDDPDMAAVCGDQCLHILVQRWRETGTFDAPAVRNEPVSAQRKEGEN